MSDGEDGHVPSYLMPSASSVLSDYTNAEQDYIKAAFSSGSCLPIRGIPDELKPSTLSNQRQARAQMNRERMEEPKPGTLGSKRDTFSDFKYVSSRYSLFDELKKRDRLVSEAKRMAIAGTDFVPSGAAKPGVPFPHLAGDDYDAREEQLRRAKWIQDSKILHGPFVPAGKTKPLESGDRSVLPILLRDIHKAINADWGDSRFEVISTEDDAVVVRFDSTDLDSPKGVYAYMNTFASGPLVRRYGLVKIVEDWNSTPGDGWLYYMFRPPWVRVRTVDTYFTLHPEDRTFKTSVAASAPSRSKKK